MKIEQPILFSDDVVYERWRKQNVHAFVLTTAHSFTQVSSVVHKANCSILDAAAASTAPGRLTGGTYYKVGSPSIEAARSWLRDQRTTTSARLCTGCFGKEIENPGIDGLFGFQVGALYNRKVDIHGRFGGQAQGGISTPKSAPVVFLFTGESGLGHGYDDQWTDGGVFHYVGEGQVGDMRFAGGNLAIRDHQKTGKALLLFQSLGKSEPYRFIGRFELIRSDSRGHILDSTGSDRSVIVFEMQPQVLEPTKTLPDDDGPEPTTTALATIEVRTKQGLFRQRVARVENGCRVTGVRDLRFLIASHIKPWGKCETARERIDGSNGLLLAPHVDLLFDAGWISFTDDGRVMISGGLPTDLLLAFGLQLHPTRRYGEFNTKQREYLTFHRAHVFKGGESASIL